MCCCNFTHNGSCYFLSLDSGFIFKTGLTTIDAALDVSGNADIVAAIGFIEASANLEADIAGRVSFSAGQKGQLIEVNEWLSKIKNLRKEENAGFAEASLSFDGSFSANIQSTAPFMASTTGQGEFKKPFELNLFATNATSKFPDITFDIDLPNLGVSISDIPVSMCCFALFGYPELTHVYF